MLHSTPYEQDENTLTKLQRSVTLFLAKRAKVDPTEDDPEFADILLTGKPINFLEPEQMQSIIATLTDPSHSFVDYIDCYKPHLWHWAVDCVVLSHRIGLVNINIADADDDIEPLHKYEKEYIDKITNILMSAC